MVLQFLPDPAACSLGFRGEIGLEFQSRPSLGAIIGAERHWHQRIAGLRANALVSAGAAMFVSISHLVPVNPTSLQVAAQVVSGIGFLGAGVTMREGLSIRGLNTAATLWCSATVI